MKRLWRWQFNDAEARKPAFARYCEDDATGPRFSPLQPSDDISACWHLRAGMRDELRRRFRFINRPRQPICRPLLLRFAKAISMRLMSEFRFRLRFRTVLLNAV